MANKDNLFGALAAHVSIADRLAPLLVSLEEGKREKEKRGKTEPRVSPRATCTPPWRLAYRCGHVGSSLDHETQFVRDASKALEEKGQGVHHQQHDECIPKQRSNHRRAPFVSNERIHLKAESAEFVRPRMLSV
jgi:hypothetical protein